VDCCIPEPATDSLQVPLEDRWIFSRLNRCAEAVNRAIEQYRFHEAAQTLWQFIWHEFCDWYLELKKLRLEENSGLNVHWRNLLTVYEMSLRLLHPIMPFLTEELWQRLVHEGSDRPEFIALAQYPKYNPEAADSAAEYEMSILQEIITAARELRADMKVDAKQPLDGVLILRGNAAQLADTQVPAIEKLANVRLTVADFNGGAEGVVRSAPEFDLILRVTVEQAHAQRTRLLKEVEQLEKVIANSERQLADEKFTSRAPASVVASIRQKLDDYKAQLLKHRETLG
jgi:valyl-tRNA synthetase